MSRKAIREYFKAIYARYRKASKEIKQIIFKRILFQYWVQSEVCYPEIKWPHPSENHSYTPAPEETYLRAGGFIDFVCCMGGSGLSLFSKIKSLDKTLVAVDTKTISAQAAGRETVALDQRPSDGQKAQRQESSSW